MVVLACHPSEETSQWSIRDLTAAIHENNLVLRAIDRVEHLR